MAHSGVWGSKQVTDALIHSSSPESHHITEGICTHGKPNMETQDKQDKEAIRMDGEPDTGCCTTTGGANGGCSLMQAEDGTQLRESGPEKAERSVSCGSVCTAQHAKFHVRKRKKWNKPCGVGLELEVAL